MEKITTSDLNVLVDNFLKKTNFATAHISSMNEFYSQGLSLILTQFFEIKKTVANKRPELLQGQEILNISVEIHFKDVELSRPQLNGKPFYPADARLSGKTYSGALKMDIHIKLIAVLKNGKAVEKEELIKGYEVADLPIIVGTNMCHTWGLSNAALYAIGEDPTDLFSYAIINGSEWFINNVFSRKFNVWHYYHNETEQETDLARAEIISMPGDSYEPSAAIDAQFLKTGEITFTFTSDRYFKIIKIPFYIILRLLGMADEQSIIYNIVPDSGDPAIDNSMRLIVKKAITIESKLFPEARTKSNLVDLQKYCIGVIAEHYVESTGVIDLNQKMLETQKEVNTLREVFMSNLDNNILPHQGKLPEHRFIKAHYLCIGINLILKCYFDIIPSTSRDSHDIKRIHTAGDSFSRMFKKEANKAIVNQVKAYFDKIVSQTPFENIDPKVLITSIDKSKLQAGIIKNLNTGLSDEKGPDGKHLKNRMPSENYKRKGIPGNVNAITITRSPNAAGAYQNERAYEMRRVQGGQCVCVIQSSEGINVGMTTNTTCGLVISKSSSTEVMKRFLMETDMIIPWNKAKSDRGFGIINAVKVMVNGFWLGYVKNPFELIQLCQERRRGWDVKTVAQINDNGIDRKHTISFSYVLDFRTDRGRGLIPYIVVRNNTKFDPIGQKIIGSKADPKTGAGFKQIVLLTPEHILKLRDGIITINDLFAEGIIDYIAAEELKLVHAADTMQRFLHYKDDPKMRFTHVFIPATLVSIISAFSPFLHNGPPGRTSLATNHLRQACSIFSLVPWMRFDKQGFYSLHNEFPLVYTISNSVITTNGINTWILVDSYGGGNQEDSLNLNSSAAERGQFHVIKYTFHKSVYEKSEVLCKPDPLTVDRIKNKSCYDKINNEGHPNIGTYLETGDIIVGKRDTIVQTGDITVRSKEFIDKSEVYNGERARVVGVKRGESSGKQFIAIRLEISRPLSEGQKFASRMGQKGMTVKCFKQSFMPFTADGLVPTLIINPHAFPTRMTLNQLKSSICGLLCCLYGRCMDGTFMVTTNMDELGLMLERKGFNRNGNMVMYNGNTGESFQNTLFMGCEYYQRLQKFSEESGYSVAYGHKAPLTRSPTSGKQNNGGLRLGEMEKDCYLSHGCIQFLREKYTYDCDGMDLYICRKCGYRSIANREKKIYTCRVCHNSAHVVKIPSRFAAHFALNCIETMGVAINYIVEPHEFFD